MSGPVERRLADLARRLRRAPDRERLLEELRAHLEDSAADAQANGLDAEAAERDAVARLGPARQIAGPRRRLLARAVTLIAAASLVGGFAAAQDSGPVNVVGLTTPTHLSKQGLVVSGVGGSRLVPLDPVTLAPRGAGLKLPPRKGWWFFSTGGPLSPETAMPSPDGQRLVFQDDGSLDVYGLRPLRLARSIRFAPPQPTSGPLRSDQKGGSLDVVKALGWFDSDRVALVVQHQAPPYARQVTRRMLYVIDLAGRRLVGRTRIALRGRIVHFAAAGDRFVAIACRDGAATLLASGPDLLARTRRIAVPCAGGAAPALALSPDGATAAVVGRDWAPLIVDLASMRVRRLATLPFPRMGSGSIAAAFAGGVLAVTGFRVTLQHQRGLGVALADPATGKERRLSPTGSSLLVVGDTVVVAGVSSTGLGRTPGAGLTAFSAAGARLWHADGTRLVLPFETGQRVYAPRPVKRHVVVDAFDLATGKAAGSYFQRGLGIVPLTGAIQSVG